MELLDKYAETQNKIYTSFTMKFEASIDGYKSYSYVLEGGKRKGGLDSEVRFDGTRFYWSRNMWANCYPDVKTFTPRDDPRAKWELWDGSLYYSGGHEPYGRINGYAEDCKTDREREAYLRRTLRVDIKNKFERFSHSRPYRRKIGPDKEGRINLVKGDFYFPDMCGGGGYYYDPQLESELRKADRLTVREKTEDIAGSQCYAIEGADKKTGKQKEISEYKVWIDPEHGYNIAKFHQVQKQVNPNNSTSTIRTKIENVRFQRIDDVWIPMDWDFIFYAKWGEGRFTKSTSHIKRTEVILNPDHDALGSFVPDIPNGWSVRFKDFKDIDEKGEYTWQDGKVVDKNAQLVNWKFNKAATSKIESEQKHPTAIQLLDKYAETQDKIKSYVAKTEITERADNLFTGNNRYLTGKWKQHKLLEFAMDDRRVLRRELKWEHDPSKDKDFPKDKALYRSWLWDGKQYLSGYSNVRGEKVLDQVQIHRGPEALKIGKRLYRADALNEYEGDKDERMDVFLRNAMKRGNKVSVLKEKEKVGDWNCYVIYAEIKNQGKYRLWIAPECGYNIAKSTHRQVGGLKGGKPAPRGLRRFGSSQVVRFKEIDGVWIPMEVNVKAGEKTRGGDYWNRISNIKKLEFVLNPDHDALGSFLPPDVRNGAEVSIYGVKGVNERVEYSWQNGEVVDDKGKKVHLPPSP